MIIAASIAIYKATGAPCARLSAPARKGSSCGGRNAWAKSKRANPMCFLNGYHGRYGQSLKCDEGNTGCVALECRQWNRPKFCC